MKATLAVNVKTPFEGEKFNEIYKEGWYEVADQDVCMEGILILFLYSVYESKHIPVIYWFDNTISRISPKHSWYVDSYTFRKSDAKILI